MHPEGQQGRIASIDLFRGLTMFLLIGEFTGLYSILSDESVGATWVHWVGEQLHHHPWNGLRFWDLIQPFFMFLVGVSIPFAVSTRKRKGLVDSDIRSHAFRRSLLLLFFGWALYCIGPGEITFKFQNVLSQIAFTYLLAFFIRDRTVIFQVGVSVALLLITELIYRNFWVEGFNQPFTAGRNFGEWIEFKINGEIPGGHWVSINAIPTAAHTIWGLIIGKVFMEGLTKKLMQKLVVISILLICLGYLMDNTLTPIIKRISTSSFVIVSGGYSIFLMVVLYWWIDVKGNQKWVRFFTYVSANSLFIYLFAHLDGGVFIERMIHPFIFSLEPFLGNWHTQVIAAVLTWYALWWICLWMYNRRIFIKI